MRIVAQEAAAWAEPTKMPVGQINEDLLEAVETEILSLLSSTYDTSVWTDETNTPAIVRVAIAKMYVSWVYKRSYAEDDNQGNRYAYELEDNANRLIEGLRDGTIDIPGVDPINVSGQPAFYPTDSSSAMEPTYYDSSLGPSTFSMGRVF